MKRLPLILAFALAASPAYALFDRSAPGLVNTGPYTSASKAAPSGQYGVSIASVTKLTVPTNAYLAEICVETASARYTDDGTTPSSTVGLPVAAGTCFAYSGPLASLQIIGAGATMDVSYYQ
jgi:hypothetical protein